MTSKSCDVLIAGGGIVGTAIASSLRQCNLSVLLLERGKGPEAPQPGRIDPRVYALSATSAALLDSLGTWEALATRGTTRIEQMRVWEDRVDQALTFSASDIGAGALGWIVEHADIAFPLWESLPPDTRRTNTTIEDLEFSDDGVHARLDDQSDIFARMVIGAEGANSRIREAAGIQTLGWEYRSTAVVCHLRTDRPHHGTAHQRFLPSGPLALLPMASHQYSVVWSTTQPDAHGLQGLDDAEFLAALDEAIQGETGRLSEPTERLSFPLQLMHAEQYVAPHCALLGDSAHVVHPLAGQGLNLGLADVAELSGQISGAVQAGRDWTSLRILSRYERARKAENLDMLAVTDALQRAFTSNIPGLRRVLGLGLKAVNQFTPARQILSRRAAGPF